MPLTLSQLRGKTVSTELEVLGETVHLTFAPGRYSGTLEESLTAISGRVLEVTDDDPNAATRRYILSTEENKAVREFLITLLVEWDVMDGDKPYPITDEALVKLPPTFLWACFRALGEANQADPQKAPNSESS